MIRWRPMLLLDANPPTDKNGCHAAGHGGSLGRRFGRYNKPDWLVSGYLVKSAHDPYPAHIAVRPI